MTHIFYFTKEAQRKERGGDEALGARRCWALEAIPVVSDGRRQLKMDFVTDTELEKVLQKGGGGLPEGNYFRRIELK